MLKHEYVTNKDGCVVAWITCHGEFLPEKWLVHERWFRYLKFLPYKRGCWMLLVQISWAGIPMSGG